MTNIPSYLERAAAEHDSTTEQLLLALAKAAERQVEMQERQVEMLERISDSLKLIAKRGE